jgi:hypothetical protein
MFIHLYVFIKLVLLVAKNQFSGLRYKKCGLSLSLELLLQRTDSPNPIHIQANMANIFPPFHAGNWFCD